MRIQSRLNSGRDCLVHDVEFFVLPLQLHRESYSLGGRPEEIDDDE